MRKYLFALATAAAGIAAVALAIVPHMYYG
jgi:hypothetical protein